MIHNVHQRTYPVEAARLGELLDRVAGRDSPLWPVRRWPPMLLDRNLEVGAGGGHGPVRYACTAYKPGRLVEFTFDEDFPLDGAHTLDVRGGAQPGTAVLRHTVRARPRGLAGHLLWPLVYRWLHDALSEDLLDTAAHTLGHPPADPASWTPWVRLLRRLAPRRPRSAALSR